MWQCLNIRCSEKHSSETKIAFDVRSIKVKRGKKTGLRTDAVDALADLLRRLEARCSPHDLDRPTAAVAPLRRWRDEYADLAESGKRASCLQEGRQARRGCVLYMDRLTEWRMSTFTIINKDTHIYAYTKRNTERWGTEEKREDRETEGRKEKERKEREIQRKKRENAGKKWKHKKPHKSIVSQEQHHHNATRASAKGGTREGARPRPRTRIKHERQCINNRAT